MLGAPLTAKVYTSLKFKGVRMKFRLYACPSALEWTQAILLAAARWPGMIFHTYAEGWEYHRST